ncbi:MAG: hypothetical protein ACRC68_17430 [Clostridium sp.]
MKVHIILIVSDAVMISDVNFKAIPYRRRNKPNGIDIGIYKDDIRVSSFPAEQYSLKLSLNRGTDYFFKIVERT